MDLQEWLAKHEQHFDSPIYEGLFVRNVLSRVADLNVASLHVQHPFVDADGKPRRCDFAIIEGDDLKIALEVDGYDKKGTGAGMTRSEFVDWQRRQASLTSQGWIVLRFANTDVRDFPKNCAEHITLTLREARSRQGHTQSLEKEIRRLKEKGNLRVSEESPRYLARVDDKATRLEELEAALRAAMASSRLSAVEEERLEALHKLQQDVRNVEGRSSNTRIGLIAVGVITTFAILLLLGNRSPSSLPAHRATAETVPVPPLDVVAETSAREPPRPPSPPAPQLVAPEEIYPVNLPIEAGSASPQAAATTPHAGSSGQREVLLEGISCDFPVEWQKVQKSIGDTVAFAGPISRVAERQDLRGKPTFLTVGIPFPSNNRVEVVIWGRNRSQFADVLNQNPEGRTGCFLGEIELYEGVPQVNLRNRNQFVVY